MIDHNHFICHFIFGGHLLNIPKETGVINCVDPQNPEYTMVEGFTYEVKGKYIYFKNSIILKSQPWSLIEISKNKMILKYNLVDIKPQYQSTLELTRID